MVAIKSSCCGFAALQEDGSVVSWGHPAMPKDMANQLADPNHPIVAIQSSSHAFAALGKDGTVKTWGNRDYGGETWICYDLFFVTSCGRRRPPFFLGLVAVDDYACETSRGSSRKAP